MSTDPLVSFQREVKENIENLGRDKELREATFKWMFDAHATGKYSYNFCALGRPIIQHPQDMIAVQELVWSVRPELIIETGIAHGGSLIWSAAMLSLLDLCDAILASKSYDPKQSKRKVLGIDIDIRKHNRSAIKAHPLSCKIDMIEGSSICNDVINQVSEISKSYGKIMVFLDSNHTHAHVLDELIAYSPLVTTGSYCIVYDTIVEDTPDGFFSDRPWGKGNNPKTAVYEFLQSHPEFVIDKEIERKLQITVAPDGFLRKIS
jgi:cephalosporin hydroxylase